MICAVVSAYVERWLTAAVATNALKAHTTCRAPMRSAAKLVIATLVDLRTRTVTKPLVRVPANLESMDADATAQSPRTTFRHCITTCMSWKMATHRPMGLFDMASTTDSSLDIHGEDTQSSQSFRKRFTSMLTFASQVCTVSSTVT